MPIPTDKTKLLEVIGLLGLWELIDGDFEKAEKLYELGQLVSSLRYLESRTAVPKSRHWVQTILPDYDDKRFRIQMRVSREAFIRLTELVADEIPNENICVPIQVAVCLFRMGTYGNGASIQNVAHKFGTSEGTVVNFTTTVITILSQLSGKWINWPDSSEREQIGLKMLTNYLPNCVGFVDGTHVPFFRAPLIEKEAYWSRKKEYSMQVQIVADPNRSIRHLFVGYPGSVHDAKVFVSTDLFKRPAQFFTLGEYLIGDSAYPKSDTVIVPYKKRQNSLPQAQSKFNTHISKYRVAVEHTIGILKGRFQSLKQLRIDIDHDGHRSSCHWIVACAVLHNFLATRDPWLDSDELYIEQEILEDIDTSPAEGTNGDLKRTALCQIVNAMI